MASRAASTYARYSRPRHGHGDPLRARFVELLGRAAVASPFRAIHGHLLAYVGASVEVPDTVALVRVESGGHVRGDQRRHLLIAVGAVHVVLYGLAYVLRGPKLAGGWLHALAVEGPPGGVHGVPLCAHHAEDALYHPHLLRVNDVVVSGVVVPEAVRWTGSGHDLTLPSLLELASPGALAYLRPLVLAELVEDAVCELALWGVVSPIVHGADLRPMLLELATEKIVIGRFAGEPIAVLCQNHIDTASGHEVPDTVHARPLKACATLSRV